VVRSSELFILCCLQRVLANFSYLFAQSTHDWIFVYVTHSSSTSQDLPPFDIELVDPQSPINFESFFVDWPLPFNSRFSFVWPLPVGFAISLSLRLCHCQSLLKSSSSFLRSISPIDRLFIRSQCLYLTKTL
jgi:hypothetical protein